MQLGEELRIFLERGAGRAAQRPRTERADDTGERVGPDDVDRGIDRAGRANPRGGGRDELGAIVVDQQLRRGELAEAEVDEPDLAVAAKEQVRQPEVAVCDAMPVELGDLSPDRA